MGYSRTLLNYIVEKCPRDKLHELIVEDEGKPHLNMFRKFLGSVIVVENLKDLVARSKFTDFNELSYTEFVDALIVYKKERLEVFGRQSASDLSLDLRQSISMASFQAHDLKGENWARLCTLIGRKFFAHIVLCCLCYYKCGRLATVSSHVKIPQRVNTLTASYAYKSGMYYHCKRNCDMQTSFRHSQASIMSEIFGEGFCSQKSRKGLWELLRVAKENDVKINYQRLHQQQVRLQKSLNVYGNASSFDDVVSFVWTCLNKVLPRSFHGDKHNRYIFRQRLRCFLSLRRFEKLEIGELVRHLHITSMRWLGRSGRFSSLQDYTSRQTMLVKFIKWLFESYVVKLITNFWYVVEAPLRNPDKVCSLFIPHQSWVDLSKVWIDEYVKSYLVELPCWISPPRNLNHGFLRIVPKQTDFRPLCIPTRPPGADVTSESFQNTYKVHDWTIIRPIRDILRLQQRLTDKNVCPRCYSVRDVCDQLAQFKSRILVTGRGMPALYGVKFDMKHCYDNLNQAKVIELTEDLFSELQAQEEIFFKKIYRSSSDGSRRFKLLLSIKTRSEVSDLDMFRFESGDGNSKFVYAESPQTYKFSREQILDVVQLQVTECTTQVPMHPGIYKRRRGIFQGRPLLATFCDIVYNKLSDELFLRVNGSPLSLLLRLADDFLFLTTSRSTCEHMIALVSSDLAISYGAYINTEKCSIVSGDAEAEVDFVGLKIDTSSLRYHRIQAPYTIPLKARQSFEKSLEYLLWNFSIRLSDFWLNLDNSPLSAVLDNIGEVLDLTLDCLHEVLPRDVSENPELSEKLVNFLLSLVRDVAEKDAKINHGQLMKMAVTNVMIEIMIKRLSPRISRVGVIRELVTNY